MQRIIAATLFTITSSASAIVTVPIDTYCIDKDHLVDMIAEYEEKPLLTGASVRNINGKDVTVPLVVFVSKKTDNSFSVVEKINDETYCVLAIGSNLKPYTK